MLVVLKFLTVNFFSTLNTINFQPWSSNQSVLQRSNTDFKTCWDLKCSLRYAYDEDHDFIIINRESNCDNGSIASEQRIFNDKAFSFLTA